jgi:DNA-binding transcriptional regulator YiaG
MVKMILSIFITSALLTLSVLGFQLYQGANMSRGAWQLSQQIQTLKVEKELEEVRRAKQKDAIEYRLKVAKLNAKERLAKSGIVAKSREIGAATLYLWPLLCVCSVAASAGLFAYSKRQATIQSVQIARHSELLQQESAAAKAFEKAIPAIARSLADAIPRQAHIPPETVLDITPQPAALRAFTGHVHFSQARLDEDYDPDCVLMGRNMETGGLCQIPLDELQSLTINGLQKQGKSVLLLSVIHAALIRKYINRESVKLILVDIHAGLKDSLLTRLESFLSGVQSLFDQVFDNEDTINNKLPAYLDGLIETGKTRSGQGITLLVMDEYTESVANLEEGKEIEQRVKRLFNYRKAGIYLALAMFEAGKNNQSAKGLNVSKMSVSKALFHTAKDEGSRFLTGGADAASLDKGEYLLLLPGMAEPERIKAPLFAAMDFQPFEKFTQQNAPQITGDVETENTTQASNDENAGELTPDVCKKIRKDSKWTQVILADRSGVHLSKIKKYESGRNPNFSEEEVQALHTTLFPTKKDNVVTFRTRN